MIMFTILVAIKSSNRLTDCKYLLYLISIKDMKAQGARKQALVILKDNESLKISCHLQASEMHLCVLDKSTGEFYQGIFTYDVLPRPLQSQIEEQIEELYEYFISEKDHIQFIKGAIVFQITVGLQKKKKQIELLLNPVEVIPKEIFRNEIKAFKTRFEQQNKSFLKNQLQKQVLKQEIQLKDFKIQTLIVEVKHQEQNVKQMQLKLQSFMRSEQQLQKSLFSQQNEVQSLINQLEKQREASGIFFKIKTELIERKNKLQKVVDEKDRQIKYLQSQIRMTERERMRLSRQLETFQLRARQVEQHDMSIIVDIRPEEEPEHAEVLPFEPLEIQSQHEEILPQILPPVPVSRAWAAPLIHYIDVRFDLSRSPATARTLFERQGIIKAQNLMGELTLCGQEPIRPHGIHEFTIKILKTTGRDIAIGLCTSRFTYNDDHKIFMNDGKVSSQGRPVSDQQRRILQQGDSVKFTINFILATLQILIAPSWVQTVKLPNSFKRQLFYYVNLSGRAAISVGF